MVRPKLPEEKITKSKIQSRANQLAKDELAEKRKEKKPRATYNDYQLLFEQELGRIGLDIFSEELCHFNDQTGYWNPVGTQQNLSYLRSIARDSNGFYYPAAIEDHLEGKFTRFDQFGQKREPELLCDIPAWDGKDRIAQIAQALHCENYNPDQVEEILKHFCSGVFRRLYNPHFQNEILILKGPQGCGKDYLIQAMFGHLKQFLVPFTMQHQEKDNFQSVASGLIMWLSEFDRSNRQEQAVIKSLITQPSAFFRPSHGKKHIHKVLRASWIASCNVDDVLRDTTGNRRYMILDIEGLDWTYPSDESAQVLAQARKLAADGYCMGRELRGAIADDIALKTPDDIRDLMIEMIEDKIGKLAIAPSWITDDEKQYSISDLEPAFQEVEKAFKVNRKYVQSVLKQKGYASRTGLKGRFYKFSLAESDTTLTTDVDKQLAF